MRTIDETENDLLGIKLNAILMASATHEISNVSHVLLRRGNSELAHYDVRDMRRAIDRLAALVADIDQRCVAVEKDIPSPHRPEYAREMEVV